MKSLVNFCFVLCFIVAKVSASQISSDSPELCKIQLEALLGDKNKTDNEWASQMISSWSNLNADFLYGNTFDFGNFEQCLSIHHESSEIGVVSGQYCLFQFYSTSNRTIPQAADSSFYNYEWQSLNTRFGGAACLPSSCSPDILRKLVEEIFEGTDLILASDYNQRNFCKNANRHENSTGVWIAFTFLFTFLITLAVVQTIYDITIRKKRREKPKQKFIIFSLYTNGLNLFKTSSDPSSDVIQCIDGIKVLSTVAIIGFHSSYHMKFFPLSDSRQMEDWEDSFTSFLTFGCHYFVESFFVISGLLVSKSILKELKSESLNVFKLYFMRFMRITPAFAVVILINNSLAYYFIQKAPYAFYNDLIAPCEKYWWSALLHIQNYVNSDQMCLVPSWYLSVDFQMYLLAPLLVYLIYRFGKKGQLALIALVSLSMCYVYGISRWKQFIPNDLDVIGLRHDFFKWVYFPTHIRGSTFLIGLVLGCYLDLKKDRNRIIKSKLLKIAFWCFSLFFFGETFAAKAFFIYVGHWVPPHINAYLIATNRNILAVGMAVMIYMCHFDMGGILNRILSSQVFKPFSRMSLSVYLIHPMLQMYTTAKNQHPIEFNEQTLLYNFMIELTATLPLAMILFLLVEAPFTKIGKLLTEIPKRSKKTYKLRQNITDTDTKL